MLVSCTNLKKIGKVLTSKSVGTGPGPRLMEKKKNCRVTVSQRLTNTELEDLVVDGDVKG